MPLPPGIGTCTISGQCLLPDQSGSTVPNTGAIVFRAPTELLDTGDHVVLAPGTYPAVLAPDGTFSLTVPVNDSLGVSPTGWSYEVTEAIIGGRPPFYVTVSRSLGPTVKYDALVQAPVPTGPVFPQPWIPLAAIQAKGDVLAGSGTAVVVRVPVGVDGMVLTADATQPGGVRWTFTAGGVASVNGLTGNVVLTPAIISALAAAQNLADLQSPGTARTNLGLGGAAVANVGTSSGTVAAGNDSRIIGAVQAATATTKGDLFVATAPGVVARLGVGPDGDQIVADSSQPSGMGWKVVARDQHASKLGVVIEPFPIEACNNFTLGLSSGDLISPLGRATARIPITRIGMWLCSAGAGPTGASYVALLDEAGNEVAVSVDVTSAFTNVANEGKVIELALASSFVPDLDAGYYPSVLTQMSSIPRIAGCLTANIPTIRGHRPCIFTGGLTSVPPSINVAAANSALAAYWIVAMGDP